MTAIPPDDSPTPPTTKRNSSLSLRRAIAVLDALARIVERCGRGGSLQDLTEETGLARSTLHRLLAPLTEAGLVERSDDKTYGIGPFAAYLGGLYLEQLDLREIVRPHLQKLNELTGETANLLLRTGTEVIYIDKIESRAVLRMHSRVGGRMPIYCTSAGKALLAHLPEDVLEEVVNAGLPRRTPTTIVDAHELRRELDKIRECGYAVDDVENEPGIRCVGAAIFDRNGRPTAAISIAGPDNRVTRDVLLELGTIVSGEAALISQRLSASPSLLEWTSQIKR
ncbi:transcriptional regulator, IclR family [Paramicrobacterium humi]|uniref:Transcriptional regulator, IclR family n=1 Tax=Paramicrobacterium humi TaxID=640635 RepID=A0A1H4K7S4_9MICO|nr:IclR family transcriptional regulator [Microbacterium humi]SEB54571.1 transcriptional regulator, IclR family [Microbacterium humi]